jgi:hypothetical protein
VQSPSAVLGTYNVSQSSAAINLPCALQGSLQHGVLQEMAIQIELTVPHSHVVHLDASYVCIASGRRPHHSGHCAYRRSGPTGNVDCDDQHARQLCLTP